MKRAAKVIAAWLVGAAAAFCPVWFGGLLLINDPPYWWRYDFVSTAILSLWVLVIAVPLVGSVAAAIVFQRTRPTIRGRCFSCGYDLRGSPGDCPECGAARPPAKP